MISVSSGKKLKQEVSPRVLEMRRKIHDLDYIDSAIHRIALVLSRKLVENNATSKK